MHRLVVETLFWGFRVHYGAAALAASNLICGGRVTSLMIAA
jgi:hypothetical protein